MQKEHCFSVNNTNNTSNLESLARLECQIKTFDVETQHEGVYFSRFPFISSLGPQFSIKETVRYH